MEVRYQKIREASAASGPGGLRVLDAAFGSLQTGGYELVGIEDLWTIALKEGKNLFPSSRLWSATNPQETGDMLGQTTVGPWQMTLQNIRKYGASHRINENWPDEDVIQFVEARPELQAKLAADYMEESYRTYGLRTPHALQNYFWLEGFLQKQIGQGPWYASVLAKDPQQMRHTGFYAKQLLLGSRFNPRGLLYWLHLSGDKVAIRSILASWRGLGYPISLQDLNHCDCEFLHDFL